MQKKFIISIIIVLNALFCLADQYSLEQLITIAQQNSYDAQYAEIEYKNACTSFHNSIYDLLPSASITFDKSNNLDNASQEWYNTGLISLEKSLYLNDPAFFNIIDSNYDRQNAQLAQQHSEKTVAFNVFDLYLDVLEKQTVLDIQQKNYLIQQKIHEQTSILYENGKASLLDLKQSEIYLIDYDIALKDAQTALLNARNSLFNYLNIDDDGSVLAVPEFAENSKTPDVKNSLIIRQKLNNIKKVKTTLLHQNLNFLPDLSLSYTLYHTDQDGFIDHEDYIRSTNELSISASWNIPGLLSKSGSQAITRRSLKLLHLDLENYRRQLNNDLSVLDQELDNLKSTRELFQQKLDLARQNLEMAQQQYQLGTIDLIDLDQNRLDLQNAQLSYNTRYYELIRKQEEINLLLSRPILGKW